MSIQYLKYFILSISLLALFSCKRENEIWAAQTVNDTIIVYDSLRYNGMRHDNFNGGKVKLIDTARINGEKRARMDAKKGIYTYYCLTLLYFIVFELIYGYIFTF